METWDLITIIAGVVIVLAVAAIVHPNVLSSPVEASLQKTIPMNTETNSSAQTLIEPVNQNETTLTPDVPFAPRLTPPEQIFYSSRAVEHPRYLLPDNMDSFGASDNIRWLQKDLIPYAYLQGSHGGVSQEFPIPYDVSVINITSVAYRNPTYADLRMVICDGRDGTILTGVEIFHTGTANKLLMKPQHPVYIIVGAQYVDDFTITFETPQQYYAASSAGMQKPSTIGGISTQTLETQRKVKTLDYVLNGKNGHFDYPMYGGVSDYFVPKAPQGHRPLNDESIKQSIMNDAIQQYYLSDLIQKIRETTPNRDDQARIAISMVQYLNYDYSKLNFEMNSNNQEYLNYPYTTMYTDSGICTDKSVLLAYLLKELGYGVALFYLPPLPTDPTVAHEAVGVKSPAAYAYRNTGYAYIESTSPNIPTYSGAFDAVDPEMIHIVSEGVSFDSLGQDYTDAQTFESIQSKCPDNGKCLLPEAEYNQVQSIIWRYGLMTAYPKASNQTV